MTLRKLTADAVMVLAGECMQRNAKAEWLILYRATSALDNLPPEGSPEIKIEDQRVDDLIDRKNSK